MAKASQLWGTDPTKVAYGFDIYHGDDDNGAIQFGLANQPQTGYPPRKFFWAKASTAANGRDPHFLDHITRGNTVAKNLLPGEKDNPNNGFAPSAYHWLDPFAPAVAQAENFWEVWEPNIVRGVSLVHMLDVEPTVDQDGTKHYPSAEMALTVAQELKRLSGYYPIIYCNDSDYRERYATAFPSHMYTLCIARYATSDPAPNPDPAVIPAAAYCSFQQYTGTGRMQGQSVKQNFDLDVFFGPFSKLRSDHTIK
jgi:GH25 family lysozyme M1 (1,4-beta-N-acetylmuramidase)